jgi:hypothetical protein
VKEFKKMNFNSKTMLCFVMFITMVFSMYKDQDHWLSKEEIHNLKLKTYGSEENYQQKLKITQDEDVRKLTWEKNFEEMKADYGNLIIKYDMYPLKQYVIYNITPNSHDDDRRHNTYSFFIHVQTQRVRIFYSHWRDDSRVQVVFGDTHYTVESLVKFPVVLLHPTKHWLVSYFTEELESTSPVKKGIFGFDTQYEHENFYIKKNDNYNLKYVITLEELIPEIFYRKFSQSTRFYLNRGYKYTLENVVKT